MVVADKEKENYCPRRKLHFHYCQLTTLLSNQGVDSCVVVETFLLLFLSFFWLFGGESLGVVFHDSFFLFARALNVQRIFMKHSVEESFLTLHS